MSAAYTVKLQPKFTKYAAAVLEGAATDENGNPLPKNPDGSPLKWEAWLNHNGYKLDASGNAAPMTADEAHVILKQYR